MVTPEAPSARKKLTDYPVPRMVSEQIARFSDTPPKGTERVFNPRQTAQILRGREDAQAIGIDIGRTKIAARLVAIRNGSVSVLQERTFTGDQLDFLGFLEDIPQTFSEQPLPIGIATTGIVEGSRLIHATHIPGLVGSLQEKYDGDFLQLYPNVPIAVDNDAKAGAVAASLEAVSHFPETEKVIFIVNGYGAGAAVMADGVIYPAEWGRKRLVDSALLNPYGQTPPEGEEGLRVTRVAAGNGIQSLWYQKRKTDLSGKEIAKAYQNGDVVARRLYDTSALLTAHAAVGLDGSAERPLEPGRTIVVCQGGTFQAPDYGARFEQILANELGYQPNVLYAHSKDFSGSGNACLDGAVMLALTT